MKRRLHEFLDALRSAELPITTSAAIDAAAAVAVVGIELEPFREAIAATVIKDEADRPAFDRVFDLFFGAAARKQRSRKPGEPKHPEAGTGQGKGAQGSSAKPPPDEPEDPAEPRRASHSKRNQSRPTPSSARQLAQQRQALRQPFGEMSADQLEQCILFAEAWSKRLWAHQRRRAERSRRDALDVRRTLRRSIATGGIPLARVFRTPRPGQVDLLALCDVSHSCAAASEFLWALLRPAARFFRRTRLFAYVDQPIEIELRQGLVLPASTIDYFARSDFGRVLERFLSAQLPLLTRNTLLLILGDGRNNRRPARVDLLRRAQAQVKQVVWLNPEPERRWNSGDSVIAAYSPHCAAVLAAESPARLLAALQAATR